MSEDEEGDDCPLCVEPMEDTDKAYRPCKCGFGICLFCWHKINNTGNGLCPACRQPYDPANFKVLAIVIEKKKKPAAKEVKRVVKPAPAPAPPVVATAVAARNLAASREALRDVRVIQRNLVYVVGLNPASTREEVLRRPDFFGQYGRVIKVVLNRNYIPAGEGRVAASSAYVTYGHPQSAIDCIRACDGFVLDGRVIHCSFGTSKYCHLWLRGFPCPNPDCMYLHAVGARDDSFTKEDMQAAGRQTFHDITHPPAWRGEPGTGPDAPPPQPSSTAAQRRTVLPSVAERYWGVGVAKGCGLVSVPAATRPPLQAPEAEEDEEDQGDYGDMEGDATPVVAAEEEAIVAPVSGDQLVSTSEGMPGPDIWGHDAGPPGLSSWLGGLTPADAIGGEVLLSPVIAPDLGFPGLDFGFAMPSLASAPLHEELSFVNDLVPAPEAEPYDFQTMFTPLQSSPLRQQVEYSHEALDRRFESAGLPSGYSYPQQQYGVPPPQYPQQHQADMPLAGMDFDLQQFARDMRAPPALSSAYPHHPPPGYDLPEPPMFRGPPGYGYPSSMDPHMDAHLRQYGDQHPGTSPVLGSLADPAILHTGAEPYTAPPSFATASAQSLTAMLSGILGQGLPSAQMSSLSLGGIAEPPVSLGSGALRDEDSGGDVSPVEEEVPPLNFNSNTQQAPAAPPRTTADPPPRPVVVMPPPAETEAAAPRKPGIVLAKPSPPNHKAAHHKPVVQIRPKQAAPEPARPVVVLTAQVPAAPVVNKATRGAKNARGALTGRK